MIKEFYFKKKNTKNIQFESIGFINQFYRLFKIFSLWKVLKKILVFGGSSSFANSFYNYKKNNYEFIFVENSSLINFTGKNTKSLMIKI